MKNVFSFFIILITALCISNAKPKDYNLAKEIYFDPVIPYSVCKNDIDQAGYRVVSIDSLDDRVRIEYKLYRDVFNLQVEKIYFGIMNDTISIIEIYIDLEIGQNAKNLLSFKKNQEKNYLIYSNIDYSESSCGKTYEFVLEHDLRFQIFRFYVPIDYEANYLIIKIFPNNNLGQTMENLNNAIDDALKPPKSKKKKK